MYKKEKYKDRIVFGKQYNYLTPIELIKVENQKTRAQETYVLCKCKCGVLYKTTPDKLIKGALKSCGCYKKEITGIRNTTHGLSKNPIYITWNQMICSCNNPKHTNYIYAGAKGIKVCDRWLEFSNFFEDMGHKPSKKHTLTRLDETKDFSKENCIWLLLTTKFRVSDKIIKLKYQGVEKSLEYWAEDYNIPRHILNNRIFVYNWDIGKALTTPVRPKSKRNK